jgi:hypothetical protein
MPIFGCYIALRSILKAEAVLILHCGKGIDLGGPNGFGHTQQFARL